MRAIGERPLHFEPRSSDEDDIWDEFKAKLLIGKWLLEEKPVLKEDCYREIPEDVGRSHTCVQKFMKKFLIDGLLENKRGRGRKSSLSDVTRRKILKEI
ncbi:hypothetical protein TNCV_865601 [Trichonephila clavipes]|nr:hypothetical protein TNCV_865601 [Trichonephila clavipes]